MLLETNTALDLAKTPVKHFTNTLVHAQDYPWVPAELKKARDDQEEEERAEIASGRWDTISDDDEAGTRELSGDYGYPGLDVAADDDDDEEEEDDEIEQYHAETGYTQEDIVMSGGLGADSRTFHNIDEPRIPTHGATAAEDTNEDFANDGDHEMIAAAHALMATQRTITPATYSYGPTEQERKDHFARAERARKGTRGKPFLDD